MDNLKDDEMEDEVDGDMDSEIDGEGEIDGEMDDLPDGDRQLTTDSAAIDEGNTNDSDLGADVAGDIGPKR